MNQLEITAAFHPTPVLTTDFSAADGWRRSQRLKLDRDWRGQAAPAELSTTARVMWSERDILFGFECGYTELDVDEDFNIAIERYALWERDVCEVFVRSPLEPHEKHYREFEVAPTGQWCDLIVDRAHMLADWQWRSGMRTTSEINEAEKIFRVAMAIPFDAFGCKPSADEVWKANLFRIGRFNGERRYLTLSPTFTEVPNFHVSESFVNLKFAHLDLGSKD